MKCKLLAMEWPSEGRSAGRFCVSFLTAASVIFSLCPAAFAGDPIQLSKDKDKQGPQQERKLDNDLFKTWKKDSVPNPLMGTTPFLPSVRMDKKEERRLQNQRDEQKNFLLLEPGELTKEDQDDVLGGRGFSAEGIEKDERSRDYVFGPLINGKAGSKSAQDRNAKQAQVQRPTDDSDDSKSENKKLLKIFGQEGQEQGAHTAKELDLKNLINPSQIDTAAGKGEATLFQFFRDNAPNRPSRDQQEKRDQFERFINSGVPSGKSDPINFSPDLTQQRLNPVLPSANPPMFDLPAPTKVPDTLAPRPSFDANPLGQSFRPNSPLGMQDFSPAARQPLGGPSLPSPWAAPNSTPNTHPGLLGGSMFNKEFQKRPGL